MPRADRTTGADPIRAVSFDLFGTLVAATPPTNPADAVATALRERDVSVPDDWRTRYETAYGRSEPGAERSLYDHVESALAADAPNGKQAVSRRTIESAVDAAFDPTVETVSGAESVVRAVGDRFPIAILSNSSVPGLAARAIERSGLRSADFDAVVTSVDCGWRKPDPRAFETVAGALDVSVDQLAHVGDDPETDGAIAAAGGRYVSVQQESLESVVALLGVEP
ncbi:HAD superfamily hydrolase [Halanaeroarchaeum sp. HSR-CO]|uniref:HAD family hydrolase n=1 Tax=Halanaeroarchaeum sp. HSR-CO TaxID=2866382 RepID=UPI00217E43CE|nr:HAD family hydrolase [Halanaeroarchaeum sp. HSR-CO]UWG46797.1 HAD superfamily hydrolase [Halanaeroarchaeum sp. HSR-CO]